MLTAAAGEVRPSEVTGPGVGVGLLWGILWASAPRDKPKQLIPNVRVTIKSLEGRAGRTRILDNTINIIKHDPCAPTKQTTKKLLVPREPKLGLQGYNWKFPFPGRSAPLRDRTRLKLGSAQRPLQKSEIQARLT
jgi:hypothetical protein